MESGLMDKRIFLLEEHEKKNENGELKSSFQLLFPCYAAKKVDKKEAVSSKQNEGAEIKKLKSIEKWVIRIELQNKIPQKNILEDNLFIQYKQMTYQVVGIDTQYDELILTCEAIQ